MSARARRAGTTVAVLLATLLAVTPAAVAVGDTPGPIVVGIVLREVGPAFAVIQDPVTSKTAFYGVGSRVGDGLVKEILADRVILVSGEGQMHLRLATPVSTGPGAAATAGSTPRDTPPGSRRPGDRESRNLEPSSPYGTIATVTAGPGASTGATAAMSGGGPGDGGMAGVGAPGGPGGSEGTQNGLSAAVMLTGHMHDGSSRQSEEFPTAALRDLLISMTYSNVSGSHRQRVELYAPDGSLYQKLSGGVASSTQTLVPVGGTWITEHSLYGLWRVDVYVDRETSPIVSQAFTLNP